MGKRQAFERAKQALEELETRFIAAEKLMEVLEIRIVNGHAVDILELYDIFTDQERCQELFAKLRNKAFW